MTNVLGGRVGAEKAINKQRKQICRERQENGADRERSRERGELPALGEEDGAFQAQ